MSVIDQAAFDDLKQMAGGDYINELIDAFLEEAPAMISQMEAALSSRDTDVFRRNAHSLKSNANTFGAMELGSLAKELEMMGRENNLNVGNRLEILKKAFQQVSSELEGMRT